MDSILDALGYIGSALDKPGRAVRGLLAGNSREGLAAIPFSDSLGLTDESQRTSGKELLSALGVDPGADTMGDAAGLGVEMATDPLSYLGVGLGARLGGRAAEAGLARGPRYATTADDLTGMVRAGGGENSRFLDLLNAHGGGGAAQRAASEVSPGSTFLGMGDEAAAFQSPGGRVTRLGIAGDLTNPHPYSGAIPPGRPIAPGVLQADRSLDIPLGGNAAVRVENLPLATGVNDARMWRTRNPETMLTRMDGLDQSLADSGLMMSDRHLGNVGVVNGRSAVIDPGALDTSRFGGHFQPVSQSADPNMLMRMLIGLGGGDDAVRAAIEAGGRPNFGASLGTLGGAGGAYTGVLARSSRR